MAHRSATTGNVLLDLLPTRTRLEVLEASERAPLTFGQTIVRPDEVIRHVFFPLTGYISLITPPDTGESLEVGLVGHEGCFGATVLLDIQKSALQGLVQGEGTALRVPVNVVKRRVVDHPAMRKTLHRYLYVLMAQLAQSAACNRRHVLEARLARWLLMTADRAHSDTFRLTQVFLAKMLGVRRPGVTAAAQNFQNERVITYERGIITIVDRTRLEASSCACYGVMNAMYRQHLGGPRSQ